MAVFVRSATQIQVTWTASDTGGRTDMYYVVEHSDPDNLGQFINPTCIQSSGSSHTFSGMRAGTQYCIRVSAHNGVSDQDPENDATRYKEACDTMYEAGKL